MDIEHLSRTQIVLLALLCTFVASIATAIVTVSLLAQAPPAVTQTVNHIIQRTVEAVADTGEATTVTETTVVVKEDDLVTASIASSLAKVARVRAGTATTTPVVALGIIVSGVLLSDSSLISEGDHLVEFDATSTLFTVLKRVGEVGVVVLEPKSGAAPASFRVADTNSAKLGQTVVALSSASGARVGIGAITARYTLARIADGEDEDAVRAIDTSISGTVMGGAPLINAFGDVLGLATGVSKGESGGPGTFVALSDFVPLILGVRGTSTPATAPLGE